MWREFIILIATICVLDAVMLGLIVRSAWATAIEKIQHSPLQMRLQYGSITYLLLATGIILFVLPHIHSALDCIVWGGLFGIVVYGVFDTTNATIFTEYPIGLACVDTMWGGLVTALACLAVFATTRRSN